jgi:F0F1-type ATP synthase epsilon subunit
VPLTVDIITPSRILVQAQVDELNVPGELGYLAFCRGTQRS